MQRIRNKASREAYRKAIKQYKQPNYLQQLLVKHEKASLEKYEKFFNVPQPITNPEGDIQEKQSNHQYHAENSTERLNQAKQQQLAARENINYYDKFLMMNRSKNADQKVERQKLNIQMENYRLVTKQIKNNLKVLVDELVMDSTELENKYQQCRKIIQRTTKAQQTKLSSSKTISLGQPHQNIIDRLKNQQWKIQQKIRQKSTELRIHLNNRNDFIFLLLKSGYYQQNGLYWLLKQCVDWELQDQRNSLRLLDSGEEAGIQLQRLYNSKESKLQVTAEHFPDLLDSRSKQYLLVLYEKLKKKAFQQIQIGNDRSEPISNISPQSYVYIPDSESSIFPHSQVTTSIQKTPHEIDSKSPQNTQKSTFLYYKNSDKTIKMFRIKDLASHQDADLSIHSQTKKFNYDIKSIYANTREALAKWVQGKCIAVANSRYEQNDYPIPQKNQCASLQQIRQKAKSSVQKGQEFYQQSCDKMSKQQTQGICQQASIFERKQKQKMKFFTDSIILQKQMTSAKNKRPKKFQQQFRSQGLSLPLVQNRPEKLKPIRQSVENKQKSIIKKNKLLLYQKNVKICKNSSQTPQSPSKQSIKQQSSSFKQQDGLKQQIRILRMYPQQTKQIALKYLFGIEVKRQNMLQFLYY